MEKKEEVTPAPGDEKKEVVTPDYKALLEVEKAEKEKAVKQLGQAEFTIEKLKKEKKEEDIDDVIPSLDEEDVVKKAEEAARKQVQTIMAEQSKDTLDEVLGQITDPDKQALVKFHLENSIVRSGYSKSAIVRDVAKAVAIVDAPRREAEVKELEKSAAARNSMGSVSTAGQDVGKEVTTLSDVEEGQIKIMAAKTGQKEEVIRAKMIANKRKMSV